MRSRTFTPFDPHKSRFGGYNQDACPKKSDDHVVIHKPHCRSRRAVDILGHIFTSSLLSMNEDQIYEHPSRFGSYTCGEEAGTFRSIGRPVIILLHPLSSCKSSTRPISHFAISKPIFIISFNHVYTEPYLTGCFKSQMDWSCGPRERAFLAFRTAPTILISFGSFPPVIMDWA